MRHTHRRAPPLHARATCRVGESVYSPSQLLSLLSRKGPSRGAMDTAGPVGWTDTACSMRCQVCGEAGLREGGNRGSQRFDGQGAPR